VAGGVSNLATGMFVTGNGIPTGTYITAVDPLTNQVYLSQNATFTSGATRAVFTTSGSTNPIFTSGSTTVKLPSGTAGYYVGMTVTSAALTTANTFWTITAVGADFITLSAAANTTTTQNVTMTVQENFNVIAGTNTAVVTGGVYDLAVGQSITVAGGISGQILSIDYARNLVTFNNNATATNAAVPGAVFNNGQNGDIYRYTGKITLNSDLRLAYYDVASNPNLVNGVGNATTTTINSTATTTAGQKVIVLAAGSPAVTLGMEVIGQGIPAGAKVTAVNGTTITLSVPATSTSTTSYVSFANNLWGSQAGGPIRRVIVDGQLTGLGNLSTVVNLQGASTSLNFVRTYFELNNADNTGWSGSMTVGNAADTPTQMHVLRLGASNAMSAKNALTLMFNSTFDVGGGNVSIGDLTINAGSIAVGDGAGAAGITIENSSNNQGILTINQTANSTWNALFQDGITPTIYSGLTATQHDNSLNLIKAGIGTATLDQLNTYTGLTEVAQGILRVSVLANGSPSDFSALNRSNIGASTNAAGNLWFSGGTLQYTGAATSTDRLFTIANSGGTLDASGSGAVNFTNTGAEVTFDSMSRPGTTQIGSNTITGLVSVWDLAIGMTITIPGSGITNATITGITPGTGNNNSSITVNQNASAAVTANATFTSGTAFSTLTLTGSNTGANTLAGILSDSVGGIKLKLTKNGAGKWVLNETSTNTYSGDTTVSQGILQLGANVTAAGVIPNGTGKGNLIVTGAGTFDLNAKSETVNGLSDGGVSTGVVDSTAAGTITLTVGDGNASATYSGIIQNSGGASALLAFTKIGTGVQTLAGANTYSGDTTVTAGTLQVGSNANVIPDGSGKGNLIVNGTFDLNGFNEGVNGFSGTNTGIVDNKANSSTSTFTIGGNGGSGTFSGVIQNSGTSSILSLAKTGGGVETLSGANTYSGDTTINQGTIKLGASNVIPDGSGKGNLIIAAAGTFDMGGAFTDTVNGLADGTGGGGVVDNTAGSTTATLTVGGNNATAPFSGVIKNSGTSSVLNFAKTGTGTQTLTGLNTYSGTTAVNGGVLQVGVAGVGQTGTGAVTVASTGTLAGTGSIRGATTVNSGGFLKPGDTAGTGTGALTFISGLTMSSGSVATMGISGTTLGTFDQIKVTGGTLNLNATGSDTGMITVNFLSFTPTAGQSWDLLDWVGALGGTFNAGTNRTGGSGGSNLNLPNLSVINPSLSWDVTAFTTTGVISIINVPEPGRVMLLASGFAALALRRRRKVA